MSEVAYATARYLLIGALHDVKWSLRRYTIVGTSTHALRGYHGLVLQTPTEVWLQDVEQMCAHLVVEILIAKIRSGNRVTCEPTRLSSQLRLPPC